MRIAGAACLLAGVDGQTSDRPNPRKREQHLPYNLLPFRIVAPFRDPASTAGGFHHTSLEPGTYYTYKTRQDPRRFLSYSN